MNNEEVLTEIIEDYKRILTESGTEAAEKYLLDRHESGNLPEELSKKINEYLQFLNSKSEEDEVVVETPTDEGVEEVPSTEG